MGQRFVKELDNLWYYYKVHVTVGIIIVVAILYIFLTWNETKDTALNIIIAGNDVAEEQQMKLQKSSTEELLGSDSDSVIKLDFWMANDGLANGRHGDLQGKLMAMYEGRDIDVFIMDTDAFHLYAEKGAFLKLDSIKDKFPNYAQHIKAKKKDEPGKHVFGIKMDRNERLRRAGFDTKDKVLAISERTEHPKLSSQWVEWLLKTN